LVILGIDPGFARVGYGLVRYEASCFRPLAFGCIETSPEPGKPFERRLVEVYDGIRALTGVWRPEAMAVEKLFFGANTTTAVGVAQARGCILLAAAQEDIPVHEYAPLEVKMTLAGYGRAAKPQLQEMTRRLLGLKDVPKPDDTADALAVAICHAYASRLKAKLAGG